ncbi:uncharacterized protein LOC113206781 isoform X3 [Frankliniella occidentalis]|uniref:Uncharacterized protein LOC113206781 isoform X3 n=1 Tax=Frankliniella occidentalis TaxID=133901 RepID=A0A9C6XA61_FRAOC|nr:uncharacterized protein LOC113206781 isoform X3 [Frankliniella occidentalis]
MQDVLLNADSVSIVTKKKSRMVRIGACTRRRGKGGRGRSVHTLSSHASYRLTPVTHKRQARRPPHTAAQSLPGPARCRMATTPWVSRMAPLLTALVLCASAARRITDGTHLELRPRYIRPCADDRNNAVRSVQVSFEMRGRTTVVFNVNGSVARSVDRWSKGTAAFEKCDQAGSSATCTTYKEIESNDICGYMLNPAMPWARVVDSVHPKLSCPITEGTYTLSNGTLSMDLINSLSSVLRLEGYIWRAHTRTVDSRGDTHLCVDSAGEFFRVRNRPKKAAGVEAKGARRPFENVHADYSENER